MKNVLAIVAFVFSTGINADVCSEPLSREIERGNLGYLIDAIKTCPTENVAVLVSAIKAGNHEITLLFLEKGMRTDFETDEGDTPLILAVKMQLLSFQLLKLIVSNGANIEHVHKETGMTALMYAAANGFIHGIQLLSDAGASMDRINVRTNQSLLHYAANKDVYEFLMKSHRYFAKSLNRYGFALEYDEQGFARRLAMGADGVVFKVTKDGQTWIAKFCYKRDVLRETGILEYQVCKDDDAVLGIHWRALFNNPMQVEKYDFFTIKTLIKGQTLAQWASLQVAEYDISSDSPRASLARNRLKSFIIRMLRAGGGFVGDLNASNLIFSEESSEWVVIDGHKMVACYSQSDHEWIWTEYCDAVNKLSKESVLDAFKSYAVGPNPTGIAEDDGGFGIWLKERAGLVATEQSKIVLKDLISAISITDLN